MIEELIREYAETNFGTGYFPLAHGSPEAAKPFGLMVKKKRSKLKRPWKSYEYEILDGLVKYVKKDKENEFLDALNLNVQKTDNLKQEGDEEHGGGASRKFEVGFEAAKCVEAKIKLNEELGDLELGKIDQEYITDPDLRRLLADTELNINLMKDFKGYKLRLITKVIYSERFEVKGKREKEYEVDAGATVPTQPFAQLKGHVKMKVTPPKIATRNTRGPFLLKCHRVVYDEESNRLKLAEFVGHEVHRDINEDDEEEEEYEDTVMASEESDLADSFTKEDSKKLEKIMNSVLIPTKNREERKVRVNKYLKWFQEALTKDQKKLTLNEPLTDADREFLQRIFVPAPPHQTTVDLSRFDDEKIQGYAIVLKFVADISDEEWDGIEKAWAESK